MTLDLRPTSIESPCYEWGLLHQSVFSVCQVCEEAVGLIVSQDGSIKAVKTVDDRRQTNELRIRQDRRMLDLQGTFWNVRNGCVGHYTMNLALLTGAQ